TRRDRPQMSPPVHDASCPRPISHVLLVLPAKRGRKLSESNTVWSSKRPGASPDMDGQLAPRSRGRCCPSTAVMSLSGAAIFDYRFREKSTRNQVMISA